MSAPEVASALPPRTASPSPAAAPVTLLEMPDGIHAEIASRLSMRDLEAVVSTARALHRDDGAYVNARNQLWAVGTGLQVRTDQLDNEESVFQHLLALGLAGGDAAQVARLPPTLRAEEITESIRRLCHVPENEQALPEPGVRSAPSITRAIESLEPPQLRDSPLSAYVQVLAQQEQIADVQTMMPWLLNMAAQMPAAHRRMTLEALLSHGIPNLPEAIRAEVFGKILNWAAQAPLVQRGDILRTAVRDGLCAIPEDEQLNGGVRLMELAAALPKDGHAQVLSLLLERSHIHFPLTAQAGAFVATKAHWPRFDNLSQWRPLLQGMKQHIERQPYLHRGIYVHEVIQHLTTLAPPVRGSALAAWVGFNHAEIPDPDLESLTRQSLQDIDQAPAALRAELAGTLAPLVRQHAGATGDALWNALMDATQKLGPLEQVDALASHLEAASASPSSGRAKLLQRLRPVLKAHLSALPPQVRELLETRIRQHADLPFQRLVLGSPGAFDVQVPLRFHAHLAALDEIATVHPDPAAEGPRAIRLALAALNALDSHEHRLTLINGTIDAAMRLHLAERIEVLQDVMKAVEALPAPFQHRALQHLTPVLKPTLEDVLDEQNRWT